ncbi:MAG: hypothetical protein GEV28_23410, partial [Actinophytocola sp.]|nr:hypothetical protein [Actinophytocola sp.]
QSGYRNRRCSTHHPGKINTPRRASIDYPATVLPSRPARLTSKCKSRVPITRHDFHGEWNYCLRPPTRP